MTTSTKRPETAVAPSGRRMSSATKWLIGIGVLVALGGLALLLGLLSLFPTKVVVDPVPVAPTPEPTVAAIPDGDWFAFVTVGRDESGIVTLGVDLAEMLTGQEAHDAAVDAGVIGVDDDLPNDFFIANPESVLELMKLADTAEIHVIPADDVSGILSIDAAQLEALYEGNDLATDVYGIVPGQPIAMDVSISDGQVTGLSAVYLP